MLMLTIAYTMPSTLNRLPVLVVGVCIRSVGVSVLSILR